MKATRLKEVKRQSRAFERANLAAGEAREGGGLAEPAVDRAQRSIRPKAPLKSGTFLGRAVLSFDELLQDLRARVCQLDQPANSSRRTAPLLLPRANGATGDPEGHGKGGLCLM